MSNLIEKLTELNAKFQAADCNRLALAHEGGEHLVALQSQVGHGGWLPTLKKIGMKPSTAANWQRIAERWDELTAKVQDVAKITYTEAVKLLRTRKQPQKKKKQDKKPIDVLTALHRLTVALDACLGNLPDDADAVLEAVEAVECRLQEIKNEYATVSQQNIAC